MEKTNKKGFLAWFTDNWKRKPLFSTGIALLVMVILQILALGFDYASFGEWVAAFSRNWINILRNNAGVGIIALGMTFVIISGGIDLAVGSTMVAIGAVVMSLIDGGPAGLLAHQGVALADQSGISQVLAHRFLPAIAPVEIHRRAYEHSHSGHHCVAPPQWGAALPLSTCHLHAFLPPIPMFP